MDSDTTAMDTTTDNVTAMDTTTTKPIPIPTPIPKIIELLDQLNQTDTDSIKQLQDYILQNPMSLNIIFAGMSVYSYATSLSLLALETLHETFILIRPYFKKVIKQYPYQIRDTNGYSPLHNAVEFNLPQQAKYLLETVEINPNVQDTRGNTPLHLACLYNREHIFQILLFGTNRITDLNTVNGKGETALMVCAKNDRVTMARDLLVKGAKWKYPMLYRRTRIERNIYAMVLQTGTPAMKLVFNRFYRSQKNKDKSSVRKLAFRTRMKKLTREYEFVCSSLQDESNKELVNILANKLNLDTSGLTKRELCERLANKIHLTLRMKR
ncbi:MAG: ankyrin repeat domain-containing protein [Proteobacteria bacterium]|nr:ankyrin repeat domain-containing protein [Pseudomonadota bacterium]NBP15215.1 ankyrin repeat domain-containing protein [bacterium]